MLRHLIYAAFAVMLGVAMMILPLMMFNYHVDFTRSSQPQLGETEKTLISKEKRTSDNVTSKETFDVSVLQRPDRLSSRFVSSFPYAMFIVATGLAVAITVFLLAKRRFL